MSNLHFKENIKEDEWHLGICLHGFDDLKIIRYIGLAMVNIKVRSGLRILLY